MKTFSQALRHAEPAITIEPCASPDRDVAALCACARRLAPFADAFVVSADSTDRPVSPVALAALIQREGIDPLPRLSRRGRNRIAQMGDLLGLRALGVTSFLLAEESEEDIQANEQRNFMVGAAELIGMANDLGGTDWDGSPHEFLIGRQVAVPATGEETGIESLAQLAQAGLRFLQLRPGPDPAVLRDYLDQLVARRVTWQCSIIITLDLRDGIEPCAEQAKTALGLPGVSGIHLLNGDDLDEVKAILSLSGVGRQH